MFVAANLAAAAAAATSWDGHEFDFGRFEITKHGRVVNASARISIDETNTCLEATGRIGMELGYHVTLVRDATSARSHEALHAAMNIDGPTYAHEILSTAELVAAMSSSKQ